MQINGLIEVLKNGYGYEALDEAGETYRVLVPPNKYMRSAAKVIESLIAQGERDYNANVAMMAILTPEEVAELEKTIEVQNEETK